MKIINNLNAGLEAIGIRKPVEEKSYTGKLWSNYTNKVLNAEPTKFKAVNIAARIVILAGVFIPVIGTLFTIIADAAVMVKKGAVNLKNRFSKKPEGNFGKLANFIKSHKLGIAAGIAVIAAASGSFIYRNEIAKAGSYVAGKAYNAKDYISKLVYGDLQQPAKPKNLMGMAYYRNEIAKAGSYAAGKAYDAKDYISKLVYGSSSTASKT